MFDCHAHWLNDFFSPGRREIVLQEIIATINLLEVKHGKLNIAVRGLSGTLIGAVVAHMMGRELMVIRIRNTDNMHGDDPESNCNSHLQVENAHPGNYIILDDFISSGFTVSLIKDKIEMMDSHQNTVKCVGIVTYGGSIHSRFTFRDNTSVPVYYPKAVSCEIKDRDRRNNGTR